MNIRECILHVLMDMEANETLSHIAVKNELEKYPEMSPQDRRFLRHVVRGTLEKQMLLDARIDSKSKVKVRKMKPLIRQILRMSAYQLFFMDRVPPSAVCNEAVKLVQKYHMQGLKGFVNGVLRSIAREANWPELPEDVACSVPSWILKFWEEEYGNEAKCRLIESLGQDAETCFRIRRDLVSEEEVLESLRSEGAAAERAPFPEGAYVLRETGALEQLTAMEKGWIQIQDISSMMVGSLSGVEPGMRVLDVCAAPGGKSMHLAELMMGRGEVISCDLTESKVRMIRENTARAGLSIVHPVVQDATVFRPEWEGTMDVVVADLPCSGLGVFGRKPEIRYRVKPEDVTALSSLQRDILKNVSRYVKPGGLLLYSTCTVSAHENRKNREWILKELPFDVECWQEDKIPERFRERAAEGSLQILPGVDPCDGFYLARFRRRKG